MMRSSIGGLLHRTRRGLALIVAAVVIPGAFAHAPAGAESTDWVVSATSAKGMELCLDASGDPRRGDFDILVLLDDSGSLQQTDAEGLRYEALGVLLRGLVGIDSEGAGIRARNIALVSYGERVDVLLPFRPLVGDEVDGIVADVRSRAPGRQRYTDFIGGVSTAVGLLGDRPAANCRILVWFTDGDHHMAGSPSSTSLEDQLVDAQSLRTEFCAPNGLDTRIRERGINTFALMLEPLPTRPEALDASKDVMQVITGDPNPGFVGSADVRRSPSEGCGGELGRQIGRVLPAARADQLPGILADLPNEVEGALPGVPDLACPYIVDEVNSSALPDAHLIEWFSLTDFRNSDELEAPTLSGVTVITADGERLPASAMMEEISRTDRVLRVRPRADQRDRLGAGWELRLTGAAQTCLRVLPVSLTFRISTAEPQISVVRPVSLPERLFSEGQLELIERDARGTLDLDTALRTAGVSGRLIVDRGELFAEDRRLPAAIIVDGAPVVSPECAALQIPAPGTLTAGRAGQLGGPEAPNDPLQSSTCVIVPATTGDGGTLLWGSTLAALNGPEAACRVGEWEVLIDGVASGGDQLSFEAGGSPVLLQLRSLTPPDNEPRDCTGVTMPALTLEWQRTEAAIPVELSVTWSKRSSPLIAVAIASPAVLIVALLSLLLLRLINDRWMRPPDANALWGYESRAMLGLDRRGRPRIEWGRGSTGFHVDQEAIGPVVGIGREELRLESTRLVRQMPGWLRPLDEPVLFVADQQAAVAAHPPASRGRGTLPLGFREAIVIAADAVRIPTVDDPLPVRIIVLVPRSADIAVSDALETLVHQRIDQLAERLMERLRELSHGDHPMTGDASPGIAGPPPGPGAASPASAPLEDDGWATGNRPRTGSPVRSSRPPVEDPRGTGSASPTDGMPGPSSGPRRPRRGPAPVTAAGLEQPDPHPPIPPSDAFKGGDQTTNERKNVDDPSGPSNDEVSD